MASPGKLGPGIVASVDRCPHIPAAILNVTEDPISPDALVDVVHKIEHLVLDSEGFMLIDGRDRMIANRLSNVISDPIVQRKIHDLGFDVRGLLRRNREQFSELVNYEPLRTLNIIEILLEYWVIHPGSFGEIGKILKRNHQIEWLKIKGLLEKICSQELNTPEQGAVAYQIIIDYFKMTGQYKIVNPWQPYE